MEKNEIKKALYKQNPTAFLKEVSKNGIIYECDFPVEGLPMFLKFLIPLPDLGDAKFEDEMDAKLLIRWIVQ